MVTFHSPTIRSQSLISFLDYELHPCCSISSPQMEQMVKKGLQVGISLSPGQLGFVKTPVSEAPGGQFLLGQALLKRT